MSMDINWDEAPEGYPLFIEFVEGSVLPGWYKDDGDGRYVSPWGGWIDTSAERAGRCIVHRRPEPVEWDGQGVPPVGCECAAEVEPGRWENCKVVATSGGASWIVSSTDDLIVRHDFVKFRPIPTPEQKAAQERERAIQKMVDDVGIAIGINQVAAKLYDAGYRRTGGES